MSEQDKSEVRAIIAAAIAAAGPKGDNEGAWKGKINSAIPHVVSMMSDSSRQSRIAEEVMGAQVFTAIYRGYTLEETSKRCVVTIETQVSKRYPEGLEPIRSHRTDNAQGKAMQHRLDTLEDGDSLLIFKAMEAINDETKVRVLVHYEKLPHHTDKAKPTDPQPTAPAAASGNYTDEVDSERLQKWRVGTHEKLTNEQFEDVVTELGKKGYDFNGVSEIEWDTIVRPLIREVLAAYNAGQEPQ